MKGKTRGGEWDRRGGGLWSWHGWRLLSAGISRGQWSVFLFSGFPVHSQESGGRCGGRWSRPPRRKSLTVQRFKVSVDSDRCCGLQASVHSETLKQDWQRCQDVPRWTKRMLGVFLLNCLCVFFLPSSLVVLLGDRGSWRETDSSSRTITRAGHVSSLSLYG